MLSAMPSGKKVLLLPFWRPHQVLQQEHDLPLEGFAPPHHRVRILLLRHLRSRMEEEPTCVYSTEVTADHRGWFTLHLPARKADLMATYSLLVHAGEEENWPSYSALLRKDDEHTVVLRDLLFGEVWVLAGTASSLLPHVQDSPERELYQKREGAFPYLRYTSVPHDPGLEMKWRPVAADQTEGDLGSLGMSLLLHLHERLQVPVGLVQVCDETAVGPSLSSWEKEGSFHKTYLTRIEGLKPRGVFWQQGLADLGATSYVQQAMPGFMRRMDFHFSRDEEEPLYWVFSQLRLSPLSLHLDENHGKRLLALNLLYQQLTERADRRQTICPVYDLDPRYALVSGEGEPEHPLYRDVEGARLAQLAHALCSGREEDLPPRFTQARLSGTDLILHFEGFKGRLRAREEHLDGFFIGGQTQALRPAHARLLSFRDLLLRHPDCPHPTACAYGISPGRVEASLYSETGLPVLPFTTVFPKQLPAEQQWMRFSQEEIWGFRSTQPRAARSFPQWMPAYHVQRGTKLFFHELSDGPAPLFPYAMEIRYKLLTETEKEQMGGRAYFPLWTPAGPYAAPEVPQLENYRALTVWVSNPDPRPKQLRLFDRDDFLLPASSPWQLYHFRLPLQWGEVEGLSLFCLQDMGDRREVEEGSLWFSTVELWQNPVLATQYVREKGGRL